MNSPFETIIRANRWTLNYTWRPESVNICDCIEQTHKKYGDDINTSDFEKMIKAITNGAHSSPLANRRDPDIINKICTLYPDFINTKIVDNLLKCMTHYTYPQDCITAILATGYKFTKHQLTQLNKFGYTLVDIVENMTYQDLIMTFDNSAFMSQFQTDFAVDYTTPIGKATIDAKILILKNIITRYKIEIESSFVMSLLSRLQQYYTGYIESIYAHMILNVHIVANELKNTILSRESFLELVLKYPKFYDITSPQVWLNKQYKDNIICLIKKILTYYDDPIDRNMMLTVMKPEMFPAFLYTDTSNYDPMEDIFYILTKFKKLYTTSFINHNKHRIDLCDIVITHLLDNGYLKYDDFLITLISLGLTEMITTLTTPCINVPLLSTLIDKSNIALNNKEIECMYTLCGTTTLAALSDIKIFPTVEYVKMNVNVGAMSVLVDSSPFSDDKMMDYIELVNQFGESTKDMSKIQPIDIIGIYDSLSEKDKQIYIRLSNCDIGDLIRYRLTLTREFVECLFRYGEWRTIVFLLHLSDEYDYIINLIDEPMIMMINALVGRMWFYENIIIKGKKSFALPNKFYKLRYYVEEDRKNLLLHIPQKDIVSLKNNHRSIREEKRRDVMNDFFNTVKRSKPNEPYDTDNAMIEENIGGVYDAILDETNEEIYDDIPDEPNEINDIPTVEPLKANIKVKKN